MTNDEEISCGAFEYVKTHKKELIEHFIGNSVPVDRPVSLFMAGSPGAGKTEVSHSLMDRFNTKPVRIDADEIRAWCPEYVGSNAHLFQHAANKGVNALFDYALKKKHHLILDGTFAYGGAVDNIERSVRRGRKVELWFIYQEPKLAWQFTADRERVESRRVSKGVFIRAFFEAQNNAKNAKEMFGDKLILNVIIKNTDNTIGDVYFNKAAEELDHILGKAYTENELNEIIV